MNDAGEMQAAKTAPSRLHWTLPGLLEVNSNSAAVALVVPDGPALIVVSGAIASTVQDLVALAELPAASLARTVIVWGALESAE